MLFILSSVKGHVLENRKCYRMKRFWYKLASYRGIFLADLGTST